MKANLIKTDYYNSNGAVVEASVLDFGAVGDGITDDTEAFKKALEYVNNIAGVLYAPAGTYVLKEQLVVGNGVTILGDFKKPTEDDAKAGGTIFALYPKSCEDNQQNGFFLLRRGSSLNGITFWYPEQKFVNEEPIKYPATVQTEVIPSVLQNLYFVNSYWAINQEVKDDYTIQQLVRNIWGTPLYKGFWLNRAPDVCRQTKMDYRPDWWLNSGLPNIPNEKELRKWLNNNAIAFDLGSIDWHYVGDITVRGYNIGVRIKNGFGRAYNLNITDCKTCLEFKHLSYYGAQILGTELKATGGSDAVALKITGGQDEGAASINNCKLESEGVAVLAEDRAIISVQDSYIKSDIGIKLTNSRGFVAVNTDFNCNMPIKNIECKKSKLVNCRTNGINITDSIQGIYNAVYNDENKNITLDMEELQRRNKLAEARFPVLNNENLINAADFGVINNGAGIGYALQNAIDKAYEMGGGVVYVPAGEYRLETPVTIKSGVELRGTTPHFHYTATRTSYFITDYGKGQPDASALFTLEEKSGLRGISISYDKVRQETIGEYATTILGKGSDIFVIGVTVTSCWTALDFASYCCDRHYIDSFNYATFNMGLAVGGGSENGVIINAHANPGHIWDNPFTERDSWKKNWNGPLHRYLHEHTTGFYIGESKNETIYMSFIFGTVKGIHIDNGAQNAWIISHGIDYSAVGMYLEGESSTVIVDNQLVGTYDVGENISTAIIATESFTGNIDIYNLCPWNIHDSAVRCKNGTININGGVFFESGDFAIIGEGGNANVSGTVFMRRFKNDFTSLDEKSELCAFGNLHIITPYALKKGASFKGTDFDKAIIG